MCKVRRCKTEDCALPNAFPKTIYQKKIFSTVLDKGNSSENTSMLHSQYNWLEAWAEALSEFSL